MRDPFTQVVGDIEALLRQSATTESVYSSGLTPLASPKQIFTRVNRGCTECEKRGTLSFEMTAGLGTWTTK